MFIIEPIPPFFLFMGKTMALQREHCHCGLPFPFEPMSREI